jgi:2-succinyl-6-hydroxy-2,4-cyclohexadiene-1-carboxylate synthase
MTSRDLASWDGASLHVEVSGTGPPVLVLHGFTGSIEAMYPLIGPLAAANTVVAVDLLGHGRSTAPAGADRYRADELYRDLDVVVDTLRLETLGLVGYSLGGRLALGYACGRPGRVSRLAVIGAGLGIEDEAARQARIQADEALAALVEEEGVTAFVERWMRRPLIAEQASQGSAAWVEARSRRLGLDPNGLTGMLRGFGRGAMPPLALQLSRLEAPVLAVVGAEDHKFRAEADRIAELAPDARVAVVAGAGHAPHLVQVEVTADLLLDFFAEVPAS